ncbi:MAG: hypothetical protein ABI216_12360 [Devosia sp.]
MDWFYCHGNCMDAASSFVADVESAARSMPKINAIDGTPDFTSGAGDESADTSMARTFRP